MRTHGQTTETGDPSDNRAERAGGDRRPWRRSQRGVSSFCGGYLLIEYLIYIGVLAVVMGLAFSAFYRCLDNSRNLARQAEDVLRVLNTGELWRKDVREAVDPPRLISEGDLTALEIPKRGHLVVYLFDDGSIWRKDGAAAPRDILGRVKNSRMIEDRRERITSWRWEIELATKKKAVRLRPLFTFQAVPVVQTR
jgi:hypothetical protein